MHHPIQMKPADSEKSNGESPLHTHTHKHKDIINSPLWDSSVKAISLVCFRCLMDRLDKEPGKTENQAEGKMLDLLYISFFSHVQ